MTGSRINEIDLLRFFAALAVVFFHYSFRGYAADAMSVMPYPLLADIFKYGYLGVNLFFIISGFVILMTAASGSLQGFVVSRVVRLYPAFWACCTVTFLTTICIGEPRYAVSLGQYLINLTMISGFVGVPSIDGAYWSLFVEMRFYALVCIVLAFGRIQQAQIFLAIWLILTVALEISPLGKLSYFLITDYSAYFIAGATCFLIWSKGFSITRTGMLIIAWGLALFQSVNALSSFQKLYKTSMSSYAVAAIITTFFLMMLLISIKRTGFFGRNRWLLAGVLTYPLYLLHQNIGYMIFNISYPALNSHLLFWGTIIVLLGASYAIYMLVEKRFSPLLKREINKLIAAVLCLIMQFGTRQKARH